MKKQHKFLIILGVAAVVIISIIASLIAAYNDFVGKREEVESSFSTIETQLQRRADLIPNLVSTVKGYTDYEQETLTAVTEARNAFNNASSTNEQIDAANRLESALDIWVNAVTEAYPELKANEQYTALMDELSGTENRIAVARRDYNKSAKEFNVKIKKFPRSILADIFGFDSFEYFEATDGAQSVPQVSFD